MIATERRAARDATKETLENATTLASATPGWQTFVFPGTSDLYWGCFLAQISPEDFASDVAVEELLHETLAGYNCQFKGTQLQWPTVHKEALAVVSRCRGGEWVLREGVTAVFLAATIICDTEHFFLQPYWWLSCRRWQDGGCCTENKGMHLQG